ncbi:hypothetical protein V5F53_08520 [Xanthobacter sp. V4C-4]|uniref:hypothetical protein n=1 Tax=Xanthobacter cornucopiae TaxID=3119924 RepID=UPI00372BCB3C
MTRYIFILGFSLLPFMASAEPYAPTLSAEEQERHEFADVQKDNYPSGRIEDPSGATPRPTGPGSIGAGQGVGQPRERTPGVQQ